MFQKNDRRINHMAYVVSGIFFVLSSFKQETARGNLFGIVGMTIAILATFLSEK